MSDDHPSIRVSLGASGPKGGDPQAPADADQPGGPAFAPPVDIHDSPEGLTLEADLPGATEDAMLVQLEDNVLSLSARIGSPAPEGARLIHQEFHVGAYQRSFILSDEVDRDRITAELKNGVLKVFLPRADRAKARRIEIKS